ncbi:MAG: C25 family cysteine peptidase [Promethearchaeota archaeon]
MIGRQERGVIIVVCFIVMILLQVGFCPRIIPLPSQGPIALHKPQILELKPTESENSKQEKLPSNSSWIPLLSGFAADSPPQAFVTIAQPAKLQIKSLIPGLWEFPVNVGKPPLPFNELRIPFSGFLTEMGNPEVPIITRLIEVPLGADIQITKITSEEAIYTNLVVRPHQGPIFDHPNFVNPPFQQNSTTYFPGISQWFPSRVAYLSGSHHSNPIVIRGHRVVALNILPVQFNGATNSCRIISQINIELSFQNTPLAPIDTRLVSPDFESLLEHTLLNYQTISIPSVPTPLQKNEPMQSSNSADYLIITTNAFKSAVLELAEWKRQKGFFTRIVTVEDDIYEPASDTYQEKVDDLTEYIKFAYENWSPAPAYVLFVGDSDHIPPHYGMWHEMHLGGIATDLPYFTVDGPDYIPDIHYGRLSVDTVADVTNIMSKIQDYEKQPPTDPNFYRTITSLAGDSFEHVDTMNYINEYLGDLGITRNEFTDDDIPGIKSSIAAGNTLVYYYGHGDANNYYAFHGPQPTFDGWWNPPFYKEHFEEFSVGYHEWPLVLSLACNTGWFDGETDIESTEGIYRDYYDDTNPIGNVNIDGFCELATRLGNDKGAIAVVGSTRCSELKSNKFFLLGMIDALWDGFNQEYSVGRHLNLGQMMWYGKMMCFSAFNLESPLTQLAFELYHLFGDPELTIYTQKPDELLVSYNQHIGFGGPQSFWVTVASSQDPELMVQSAKVCVHGETVHEVFYTNRDGVAECKITPTQSEVLTITVTHKDFIPYQNEIAVCSQEAWITVTPKDGVTNTPLIVHGENFNPQEEVKIDFGVLRELFTFSIQGSSFDEQISVPSGTAPQETIVAYQSDRCATFAFGRWDNRPDLAIYSQWDESTWYLNPVGSGQDTNPRWNNPCIRLMNIGSPIPVGTYGMVPIGRYTIEADVYNISPEDAHGTTVLFEWSQWGIGQTEWIKITESIPLTVLGNDKTMFFAAFTISEEMNVCIRVTINHPNDLNPNNNIGVENYQTLFIGPRAHNTGTINIPLYQEVPRLDLNWSTNQNIDTEWIADLSRPGDSEGPSTLGEHPTLEFLTPDDVSISNFQRTYVITGFVGRNIISGVEITISRASQAPYDPLYHIRNLVLLNWPIVLLILLILIIVILYLWIRRRKKRQQKHTKD